MAAPGPPPSPAAPRAVRFTCALRLEQAKLLLLQTDLAVSRIAEEVGFNNAAYFTSCFARFEGITLQQRFSYG